MPLRNCRPARWSTGCTASIGAVQNFGGYLGGALAPTVTGLIVQKTGSFVPALVVGALIGVISAASYLFVVDQPITASDLEAMSDPDEDALRVLTKSR
jgi:cyanate permease